MNIPTRLFVSALAVCVLSSCSNRSQDNDIAPTVPTALTSWTPTNLAVAIAQADLIVMTNRMSDIHPEYRNYRVTLGGKDYAMPIVRAMSSAKLYSDVVTTNTVWDWTFWFYSGTNLLEAVNWHDDKFLFENKEYRDESGILDNVYRKTLFQELK